MNGYVNGYNNGYVNGYYNNNYNNFNNSYFNSYDNNSYYYGARKSTVSNGSRVSPSNISTRYIQAKRAEIVADPTKKSLIDAKSETPINNIPTRNNNIVIPVDPKNNDERLLNMGNTNQAGKVIITEPVRPQVDLNQPVKEIKKNSRIQIVNEPVISTDKPRDNRNSNSNSIQNNNIPTNSAPPNLDQPKMEKPKQQAPVIIPENNTAPRYQEQPVYQQPPAQQPTNRAAPAPAAPRNNSNSSAPSRGPRR
jgi:hypothetical protein